MVCLNKNLEIIEAFLMTINYAFSKLRLNNIIAKTASNNMRALNILKYFNFKKISKNRYEGYWANEYHDLIVWILKKKSLKKYKKNFYFN